MANKTYINLTQLSVRLFANANGEASLMLQNKSKEMRVRYYDDKQMGN